MSERNRTLRPYQSRKPIMRPHGNPVPRPATPPHQTQSQPLSLGPHLIIVDCVGFCVKDLTLFSLPPFWPCSSNTSFLSAPPFASRASFTVTRGPPHHRRLTPPQSRPTPPARPPPPTEGIAGMVTSSVVIPCNSASKGRYKEKYPHIHRSLLSSWNSI